MNIVYTGAVAFSRHCLEEIIASGAVVCGIMQPIKSKTASDYADCKDLAEQHGIPYHVFVGINDPETVSWVRCLKPDIMFVFGLSQLIRAELLKLPTMGVVGCHPAKLPANRGRHPIIWSLFLGLDQSALTFFFMDEGADSGPILCQRMFPIAATDTAADVKLKLRHLATEMIREFLPMLMKGELVTMPQNASKASSWRKRSRKDGVIDWRMSGDAILNLVRALTKPYPGAETAVHGTKIIIWKASCWKGAVKACDEPGKIIAIDDGKPVVKCYDSAIVIEQSDPVLPCKKGEYIL